MQINSFADIQYDISVISHDINSRLFGKLFKFLIKIKHEMYSILQVKSVILEFICKNPCRCTPPDAYIIMRLTEIGSLLKGGNRS